VSTRVDEAQLASLDRAVEAMDKGDLAAADQCFHEALYASVTNDLATQLISVFWDIYHQVADELEHTPVDRVRVVQGHRRVVEALRSGDRARARQALLNHFADLRERVQRLVSATPEPR
jgi:DNA-binding FadR family transcriptional regulator